MNILFYCGIHNLVNFSRIRPYYDVCYGFDANPEKIEQARKVYINDPAVHIIYGALTAKGGEEIEFNLTTDWTPASSVGNPNPEFVHMKTGLLQAQKKIKVPTINLHDFCTAKGITEIDTLITDLQGIDLTVLKTLEKMIREGKIREIQCEVEPDDTPQRYLGIPPSKFQDFKKLLAENYDVLWIDPPAPPEGSWEMDVRWRAKGGQPLDDIEFVMEKELLVAKIGATSSLSTYSQYKEDLVIATLFKHKGNGFYVDIGANDPDIFSNTKLFYGRGWQGINVEPEPNMHAKHCAKRLRDINLRVGVGPEPGMMTFYRMSADTLSSFNKQAALEAGKLYGATLIGEEVTSVVKLSDILTEHLNGKSIDFLSVDAEGYDLAVLESNDWSLYRPSLIIVEINVGGDDIIAFLQKQKYILIFDNGTNGIFITQELCESLDDSIRDDLKKLEQKYALRTVLPPQSSEEKLSLNVVYGHLPLNQVKSHRRGNVSIIWSAFPVEGCDHHVYINAFSYRGKLPGLNILLMLEPAVVLPGEFDVQVWNSFDHVFGLFDALSSQGAKFHKIFFPRADGSAKSPITELQSRRESLYPLAGRKKAICMISGNKSSHVPGELYSKRIEIAQWFFQNSKIPFDVYGKPPFELPNYRGVIPDGEKLAVQKQYRYSLCFENTNHPVLSAGYITEKIIDCLETRTIPIYLGASNIDQYVPRDCFIDFRKFASYDELDKYLRNMSNKDYERYVSAIDRWVSAGNLRNYSFPPFYDELAKICAAASAKSLEKLFHGEKTWGEGKVTPPTARNWKFIDAPEMWTWKHLSKAEPPEIIDGKIVSKETWSITAPTGNEVTRPAKSLLIGKKPSLKILIAGAKFFSGNARCGYDYFWWNMLDTLRRLDNIQTQFFDYATEAQQRGIAGMSERIAATVHKEKPDIFFYNPSDLPVHILCESLNSITALTDTQTVIWMNDSDRHFDSDASLWAPCVDYIITTSPANANKYQEAGFGRKIIRSQWAFNPLTYPSNILPKTRAISFVGSARGNRSDMIDKMRLSSLSVDAFGDGWHDDSFISFYDMVRIFGQSKINLHLSDTKAASPQPIPRRIFEVAGCGGFLITQPSENLEEYYEPDKDVVVASSLSELIDKAKYYLSHEREREGIARHGHERTLAQHTWTQRLADIFRQIGFSAIPQTVQQNTVKPQTPTNTSDQPAYRKDNKDVPASIIVLAYNQLQYTKQCVESIMHYTNIPYELMLVDNGSTDGTFDYFEWIKSFHPHTRIIRNFHNRIAESNLNYATSIACGEYIVFVTNDTMVHEGWLDNLIRQIESAPDIGIVGPRSNNISGPQIASAEYDTIQAFQPFAAEWCKQHRGENFPVERMVGMLTIMKRAVLERVGGLDPDLPANGRDGGYGFSDDDISLRFLLAGYRLLVANDVFIHHFGSMTTRLYRPDLFGAPQNINKEKFSQKMQRNDLISIGLQGEITLKPYRLDDRITIAENTVIRSPRIRIVESNSCVTEHSDHPISYTALAKSYHGEVVSLGCDSIQHLLTQTLEGAEFDFMVLVDRRLAASLEKVQALIETALCYPDVAVMVPIGNFAPCTHKNSAENGTIIEIIQYADMSFCVINIKLIRPFLHGTAQIANNEELLWFLQRRVRGEGYFIAKVNNIVIDSAGAKTPHLYEDKALALPEQLIKERKYAQAVAILKNDLLLDPAFAESNYQLACIAREQRQAKVAIKYAEEALKADAHHILSLVLLFQIFLEQGDFKNAATVVRKANLKQPGHPEVQKIVNIYETKLKEQPAAFPRDMGSETPFPTHSEGVMGKVSIIIRAHSNHLQECVSSINKYTKEPHEIIFVDHGAAPHIKKQITKIIQESPQHKMVDSNKSANFAQSINEGINQSTGEYIVLLFDDVIVGEDWLSDMLGCLQSAGEPAIVGPMSASVLGPQNVPDADLKSLEETKEFRERNRHRRIYPRNLEGFCLLFRRELPVSIGPFDEGFASDSYVFDDFCLRAALAGFRNVIAGGVFVHNQAGPNTTMSRNNAFFDEKWSGIDATSALGEKVATINAVHNAQALHNRGLTDDAVKTLIARIGFSPDEKILYYYLADILIDEKRYQDGIEAVKEMPDAQDDARYFAVLGYCSEGLGLYSEAEAYADKALSLNEKSALTLNLKGILEYKKGESEKAVTLFKKALETDPGYGEPYTNLGMLSWAGENSEEAMNFFEQGFILSPDKGDIITAYHTAISGLDLYNRAETVFKEGRTAYPGNKRILFLLIDVFLKQGKFSEAMDEVEKAMVHLGVDDGILTAALEIRGMVGPKSIAVNTEGKKKAKNRTTFSACLIVKNEEKHLARCLNSIKPIMDEIIVVDTGSSDKTRDIATAFGAKLYYFEWNKDFSAARNYSLSQAQGDMILVVDADEVISARDYKTFRKMIPNAAAQQKAYTIITRNYVIKTSSSIWQPNDGSYPEEQIGTGWFPSTKVRLFPRSESIRFENPVHELVEKSLERSKIRIETCSVPVHHYGELDEDKGRKKDEEYYELGLKKLKESGGNSKALYELAVQATELGRWDEALEHWSKVLASGMAPETVHFNRAYIYMQINQYTKAHAEAKTAFGLAPDNQAAALNYAYCEYVIGDIETARSVLENYITNHPFYPPITGLLSAIYLILGNRDKWAELNTILKKKGFNTVGYYNNTAEHLIASENKQRANLLLKAMIETGFCDALTRVLMQRIDNGEC